MGVVGMGFADTLDGGLGADTMVGGEGNDIYYIDNVSDSVIELGNGGTDEVRVNIQVQSWSPSNSKRPAAALPYDRSAISG